MLVFYSKQFKMKQFVIATLVGAVIVFALQALSWTVLPIHNDSLKYTAGQDSILGVLIRHLPEDGMYVVPFLPPEKMSDNAALEEFAQQTNGKPGAMVQYHQASEEMSPMMMVNGFLFDLLATALVVWLLGLAAPQLTSFGGRFFAVLAFSLFTILQSDLMNWNWWDTPGHYLKGMVLDHLIAWAACGLWLAWYLGRRVGSH
jgi:hypothetical protein